ncbi:hypothetical protein [Streptomyces sp. NPDC002788]
MTESDGFEGDGRARYTPLRALGSRAARIYLDAEGAADLAVLLGS